MNPEELQAQLDAAAKLGDQAQIDAALKALQVAGVAPKGNNPNTGKTWDMDTKTNTDEPWKLGAAGNASALAKLTSLGFGAASLAGAEDRQDTTVSNLNKLADKVGTSVDVDDSGVNLAELNARDDADANASTLATLLQSGVDPAAAQQIVSKQQKGQTSELLNQLNLQGNRQQTADEAAMARRSKIDAAATQAGMPIDKSAGIADLFSKAGDLAAGYSALTNPLPTTARSGRKLMYENGGGLQTTQGPSDHSENPMLITNPDGSPATDDQGNQIEVTGKETIIPDWLMEQLIEAANKGPKELKKVFKDEIIDEERFNQS